MFSVQFLLTVTNPKVILGKVAQMKSPGNITLFIQQTFKFLWLHPGLCYQWKLFHLCNLKFTFSDIQLQSLSFLLFHLPVPAIPAPAICWDYILLSVPFFPPKQPLWLHFPPTQGSLTSNVNLHSSSYTTHSLHILKIGLIQLTIY